jgi:hypothetical protein
MALIHKAGISGNAACGKTHVALSYSGARAAVTCPECQRLMGQPDREKQLQSLRTAAAKYRSQS